MSTSAKLSRRSFIAGTFALAGTAMSIPLDARARPGAPGRVLVGADRDIRLLDPAYRTGSVEGNVLRAIYRRLIRFKPESLDYELDAAAEIRQVDPTRIEFSLRPGLRFPEPYGEMTAEDVRYSLERFLARDATGGISPYARDWAALERIEVKGRYAGVIHLRHPAPALWRIALADSSGCILSRTAVEKLGDDFVRLPHGGGPYRMRHWTPNQELVLESNPEYEGATAPLSEVVIRPIQEAKTGELALRAGELDFTALDPTVARKLEGASGTRVLRRDSLNYVWVGINVEKPPFNDLRVRQAIRKAIDVDAVLLAAYDGLAAPARAVLAPGLLGYWKDAPLHPRDVAGARQLLTEAGLEPGFGAKLTLLNKPSYKTAAQVVQANLAEVGIQVELDVQEAGTFWSLGKGKTGQDLELALQRFGGKTDPSFQTQWFVSDQVGLWNWQRWRNPEFDRLDETASATLDPDERARLYVRMQKLMEESAAFVWLTHEANVFGARTWLQPAILPTGDDWQYWWFRSTAL